MSSTIRVKKTCKDCNKQFIAQKTTTQYCSHSCASRAYKKRTRNKKVDTVIKKEIEKAISNPIIAQREFLSVDETCRLINASRWTIYRLISNGKLKASKIGRNIRITRTSINKLFTLSEI